MIDEQKQENQLLSILQELSASNSEIPEKDLKYVIYARKSTDDKSEKQEYSLTDQISACKEYAEKKDLQIVKIIKEAESAKEPNIRPEFSEMLEKIQAGKYQGVIAWKPDRLARNMREAGEIIDLLDKDIIKSLQFVTFSFENTSSGKMLLGMAFVLAKQYSDQLSDNVKRGIRERIKEGKCLNKAKHGYFKDTNRFQRPDPAGFKLIKEAWKMRLNKYNQSEIAEFLNTHNYKRKNKYNDKHKIFKWDKRRTSEMFKDPFYAGIFTYGDNIVELTSVYDFVPVISTEEFMELNKIDDLKKTFSSKIKSQKQNKIAKLLNGLVYCGHCQETLVSGITKKSNGTNYFYYRCDTPGCEVKNKSTRAHVVTDFVYNFLEENNFASESTYKKYVKEAKFLNNERISNLARLSKSLTAKEIALKKKIEKTKTFVREEDDIQIKGIFKKDLKAYLEEHNETITKINKVKKEKEKAKSAILTISEFLELFRDLPSIMRKTKRLEDKDFLIRQIFLNFTLKDKKVASYKLKQPFANFLKTPKVLNGRDGGT